MYVCMYVYIHVRVHVSECMCIHLLGTYDLHIWVFYSGLTPELQPGSYQGSDDYVMSTSLVEETRAPGGNH